MLDVGAYRFSPDMHLPGDLILNHLKLPTACHSPPAGGQGPFLTASSSITARPASHCQPRDGSALGYVGAIDHMLDRMDPATVKVFKQ